MPLTVLEVDSVLTTDRGNVPATLEMSIQIAKETTVRFLLSRKKLSGKLSKVLCLVLNTKQLVKLKRNFQQVLNGRAKPTTAIYLTGESSSLDTRPIWSISVQANDEVHIRLANGPTVLVAIVKLEDFKKLVETIGKMYQ